MLQNDFSSYNLTKIPEIHSFILFKTLNNYVYYFQLSHYLFQFTDYTLVVIGCMSQIFSFLLIGISKTQTGVFIGTAVSSACGVGFVALQSLMSKEVMAAFVSSAPVDEKYLSY